MVMRPDEYTFHRRFILALREPLRQEVLKQGLNPEKSTIGQLYELTNVIEEATRYNQGTCRTEGIGTIPSMTQRSVVLKPTALSQSVHKPMPATRLASQSNQHSHPVNIVWHEHRTVPAVPVTKNTPSRSGNMPRPPVTTGDRPLTHSNIVCYECGQTGLIKPNCPKLKGSGQVAAIHTEDVPNESRNMEINQEPSDEYHLVTTQSAEEPTDEWVEEPSQYKGDEADWKSDSGGTVLEPIKLLVFCQGSSIIFPCSISCSLICLCNKRQHSV